MARGAAKKSASARTARDDSQPETDQLLDNGQPRRPRRPAPDPPTRQEIRRMAESLGRLADEGRLRILFLLEESPRNVAALGEALGQDRHSLSHHLRILRVSGLISSTRDGRRVDYALTPRGAAGIKVARDLKE